MPRAAGPTRTRSRRALRGHRTADEPTLPRAPTPGKRRCAPLVSLARYRRKTLRWMRRPAQRPARARQSSAGTPSRSPARTIPHGNLAPVAGMHVHAKQTLQDDGQSLSGRFGVHGADRMGIRRPVRRRSGIRRCDRDRSPTSASKQSNEADGREVTGRLIWLSRHWARLPPVWVLPAGLHPPF